MERLEAKQVNGHTYYYYSHWGRKDGRCRRIWQKYLGKLEDIVQTVEGGSRPRCAEVFQWGLPEALWKEACRAELIQVIDQQCRKRKQGLSAGEYLAIAAINRAICPKSERSMWGWFSQTVLLRHVPDASERGLGSQRFWDHMDRIDAESATAIWKTLLRDAIGREQIDVSSISHEGTNFYTFIDTLNLRCDGVLVLLVFPLRPRRERCFTGSPRKDALSRSERRLMAEISNWRWYRTPLRRWRGSSRLGRAACPNA